MPTLTIARLHAREVLDSRGTPTIEVDCTLSDGSTGSAIVPSGASTGSYEALELRDGDASRFQGKGVLQAVSNVDGEIAAVMAGEDATSQRSVDSSLVALDATPNKSRLGANALLGVSMAIARARASSENRPLFRSLAAAYDAPEPTLLPMPMLNVINGGKHADSGLSFQECMLLPTQFPSFRDALRAGVETFQVLKKLLVAKGYTTSVGDEGGFAPRVKDGVEAFELLVAAIEQAGYTGRIQIGIDAAASEFVKDGGYLVDGQQLDRNALVDLYAELCARFPFVSIEDSHAEDDWDGFVAMQARLGERVQLVGDDLFVTAVPRIQKGIAANAANAVLIKLNQIGTVSETVDAIRAAQEAGWRAVVSHRRGETEDTFIAHLAVALGAGQIKTGAPSRTDRVAKYNELLRIEEALGSEARYVDPFAAG